jgi:hypothetical protein
MINLITRSLLCLPVTPILPTTMTPPFRLSSVLSHTTAFASRPPPPPFGFTAHAPARFTIAFEAALEKVEHLTAHLPTYRNILAKVTTGIPTEYCVSQWCSLG